MGYLYNFYKLEYGLIGSGVGIVFLNWIIPDFTLNIQIKKKFVVYIGGIIIFYKAITSHIE
jgi:hypothetical protein